MKPISDNTLSVILSSSGLKAVRSGHPWLYESGIDRINKKGASGDIAVLYDTKRVFAGIGLYDADSPIKVRVLHKGRPAVISREWLYDRISSIIAGRKKLMADKSTTGYRLIHGENDSLPGIVLDRYAETLVLKTDSSCWLPYVNTLSDIIADILSPERIILRMSRTVKEYTGTDDGSVIYGSGITDRPVFTENGIKFYADPVNGQKTGFFLDQRENRKNVMELSGGLSVLNVFSYTGGFSLYAAAGGAESVTSLDISMPAMDECENNFRLNDMKIPHRKICGDAFEEMEKLIKAKEKFGMVIVDPPSFARKQPDVKNALKAYKKLNTLALKLIRKNGILVSASCSARVPSDDFFETVTKSIKSSGRRYREIKRTAHASDHPIGFPEGAYLKCLFAEIN